jgi:hypothetical protein
MSETSIPKGVSRETLLDIVCGWYEAGANDGPVNTADVEAATGHPDAVSRQTGFLEAVGVLTEVGQRHELTPTGARLARALLEDDRPAARDTVGDLLSEWSFTTRVTDLTAGRPLSEAALLAEVAHDAGHEPEGRARTGLTTLLDLWVWSGVLARTDEGRYEPAEDPEEAATGGDTLQVGLQLSVDVNPNDVRDIVQSLREGMEDGDAPVIHADLSALDSGEE